jgi:hypothetical protein
MPKKLAVFLAKADLMSPWVIILIDYGAFRPSSNLLVFLPEADYRVHQAQLASSAEVFDARLRMGGAMRRRPRSEARTKHYGFSQ